MHHNLTTRQYLEQFPGAQLSDEAYSQKMSESTSRVVKTPEWNAKNSASQKGKVIPNDVKGKMSVSAKIRIDRDGNPMDRPEVRAKLKEPRKPLESLSVIIMMLV